MTRNAFLSKVWHFEWIAVVFMKVTNPLVLSEGKLGYDALYEGEYEKSKVPISTYT